jgi:hypothetical protein
MALTRETDLTLRPPRITFNRFAAELKQRGSPAYPEAVPIWNLLTGGGVDPSFAIGQFHVESLTGRSGHAVVTKSWGNMLWDSDLTPTRLKYSPGNGYTYARYPSWTEGVRDYVKYIRWYATHDARYGTGNADTIQKCCAQWTGAELDDLGHDRYVSIILAIINDDLEFVPNKFIEVGDVSIAATNSDIKTSKRYPIVNGTQIYHGTDGSPMKLAAFSTSPGMCRFLGPAGKGIEWDSPEWPWGAIIFRPSGAPGDRVAYIKNPKRTSVVSA